MKRYDKIILLVLLVVFGGGIFMTARNAFDSYVTFAQAAESNRSVQVKGVAIDGTVRELDENTFTFEMEDMSGQVLRVRRTGIIPVNLFEADNVVVKGRYKDGEFVAQQILVKCPSKYEAQEK